jgi:hypothetical protein
MNKLEQYGAELAMLMRRQDGHLREWDFCEEQIVKLRQLILDEPTGTLYGADPAATAVLAVPAALRRTDEPVPLRSDRLDGGNTFRLSPIGDELTSGSMATIVQCSPTCLALEPHIHTADGAVHPTQLLAPS